MLGFAGVALALISPTRLKWDILGILVATLAACSMALGTLLIRRWQLDMPLFAFTGWQLLLGADFVAVHALAGAAPTGPAHGTSGRVPLSRCARYVTPLSALILGYAWPEQTLTFWQLLGALLVFVGIVLSQTGRRAAFSK
ncbi:hypothetical protein [Pseudomonas abyssi]|nr:hypothetical protein [Halopseudomonas gallaeciensis]